MVDEEEVGEGSSAKEGIQGSEKGRKRKAEGETPTGATGSLQSRLFSDKSGATLKSVKAMGDVHDIPLTADFVLREFFGPTTALPPNVERRITTLKDVEAVNLSRESTQLFLVTDKGEEIPLGEAERRGCIGFCVRMRGILLALVSAVSFSCSTYLCHLLMKERNYPTPILLSIRFTFMTILDGSLVLVYEKCCRQEILEPLGCSTPTKRRTMWMIFTRSGVSCLAVVFQMYSLLFIPPADSSVIIYSNPVFVAFFARIFLKEACGIFQTCTGGATIYDFDKRRTVKSMITIIGVVIVAKPPFIVGGASYDMAHLIGISLALSSMLSGTISIILVRLLRYVHWTVLNLIYPLFGVAAGLCLVGATGGFSHRLDMSPSDALLFLGMCCISFIGLWSSVLALKYEEAGTVTIVRSSEVIFSFLWQMMSNIYPDKFSLIGAFLVILCILLTGLRKVIATLEKDSKVRNLFWFVLK